MEGEAPPPGGGKRRRDVTNYVVMRRPRPLVVGRAPQADVDAEAFARFVGSWGNFSAFIGHRWEQLASEAAEAHLQHRVPFGSVDANLVHVEELDQDLELHREVERVGVSCPDALFCGRGAGDSLYIQPVDYKVSLDTASFDQVEATRIFDLATRGGVRTVSAIWRAIRRASGQEADAPGGDREALLACLAAGRLQPVDGRFIAPDTAFNRVHLRGPQNRQRERPLRSADVLLVAVTPSRFFGDLPGWAEAQLLLQADHVRADLPGDLGMAERYARLGAGVRGAFLTLQTPLFGSAPQHDTTAELRHMLKEQSSLDVLRHLQQERSQRLELLRQRDHLLRFPFRMAALAEALGRPPARIEGEPAWPADLLRSGITALHATHRERVAERGQHLLAEGLDEAEALHRLDEEWPQFRRAARADIERWARATAHAADV